VASITDPHLEFSPLERRIIRWLAIPAEPEVPEGSPGSVQVFRAGANYYIWLVIVWAAGALFGAVWLGLFTFGLSRELGRAPTVVEIALLILLPLAWIAWLAGVIITFVSRRINFRLRWYVVTDRSLRIRSGVFSIKELTMTYRNVQEIRVTAGLLENAMGLATVEVHAAGGGVRSGSSKTQGSGGHVGKLEGLANANEIRDLIVARLRRYRDAGLGDPLPTMSGVAGDAASIEAAKHVLDEARALRVALGSSGQ
jgi:membrane protein YdbS with pleckstrin-like domain